MVAHLLWFFFGPVMFLIGLGVLRDELHGLAVHGGTWRATIFPLVMLALSGTVTCVMLAAWTPR
jgi:hypothetical protein